MVNAVFKWYAKRRKYSHYNFSLKNERHEQSAEEISNLIAEGISNL